MAVYFATKAYILSFSEAIANELEGTGVTVTVLCPGSTASAFHERTGMADSKMLKSKNMMDAETVAQIGYNALIQGKTIVIPGFMNKIMSKCVRFIPRKIVTKIVRSMRILTPHKVIDNLLMFHLDLEIRQLFLRFRFLSRFSDIYTN